SLVPVMLCLLIEKGLALFSFPRRSTQVSTSCMYTLEPIQPITFHKVNIKCKHLLSTTNPTCKNSTKYHRSQSRNNLPCRQPYRDGPDANGGDPCQRFRI
ncbi:hypothetical protein PV325_008812, partial [Microctonus aethiopoides]